MAAAVRIALAFLATLVIALMQSRGCGYTPDPAKGEGEPCTRTSECQSHLTCSGGVCRVPGGLDAGPGLDGGPLDDGGAVEDAGDGDAAVDLDAGDVDADVPDGGDVDAGDPDAGDPDAGDPDAG